MSDQKRATFSTISTQKSDVKKVKEKPRTLRFFLTLPESNEKSCPEYNYRDLCNSQEKKNKLKDKNQDHIKNGLNPGLTNLDPFDEDDDDVKRIAKQFEAKYGGVPKKKRRGKKDDYADIGAGYDESDSFIDNTDAYDEMVPENVTTLHGGFYINSGALEFKQIDLSGSEESSDSDSCEKISTSRKRIIEDSEESDTEDEKEETKKERNKIQHLDKKHKVEINGLCKPIAKKKLILEDREIRKKRIEDTMQKKKAITVKDLLREKREELEVTLEPEPSSKELKPSGNSTISDAIESVIKAVRSENIDETSKQSTSCGSDIPNMSAASSECESSRDGTSSTNHAQIDIPLVKLPDNIPLEVFDIIIDMKKAAENSSEGKVKFFSGPVNDMLLNLEVNSRKLVKSDRMQIYEHLAPFVKCKKDTLMRRAKNLLLDHEMSKLKEPLQRLKVYVENLMPLVKRNYEKECQKVRDEMFMASANANAENGDANCKIKRTPRKKFPWSEELRKIFQEIIAINKKCFALEGHRKSFEANLEQFFKSSVLPIWPDGWMSIAALNKQTKIITENSVKHKMLKSSKPFKPISLDINALPFVHATMKKSPCPGASSVTVIPISQSTSSSKLINGPKVKHHSPTERKSNELNIINKKSSDINTEISVVNSKEPNSVPSSLLIPTQDCSVTITSVDLRTNTLKKDNKDNELSTSVNEHISKPVEHNTNKPVEVKPTNLKQRILENVNKPISTKLSRNDDNDDCQIIDLTESPVAPSRKPGPKSKISKRSKDIESNSAKSIHKDDNLKRTDEITGTQALNQLITGLTKYSSNLSEVNAKQHSFTKENPGGTLNEDDMEQVMKDLKELQQMQEHARKHDLGIMSSSNSPVSVIAYNNSYSPTKLQTDDLASNRRQSTDGVGFQDIFQKQLFQDPSLFKSTQSSSVYNAQQKNSYNSINNFSYSSSGNISNSINNLRFSQNPNKYSASVNHLPANSTGTKQKSPP